MPLTKELLLGLTAACFSGLFAVQAQGAIQAQYTFDDLTSSDTDPATDASDVSFGGGDFSSGTLGSGIGNAAFITVANANEFVANAISNGDFLSFDVENASGVSSFSIDQVSYFHHLTDTGSGPTYRSYLFSSLDGGLVAGSHVASSTIEGNGDPLSEEVIFNASSSYDNITGPVTFWIVATDDTSGNTHGIDNIVVEGTPEPSSLALLGLGGMCLFWHRRRA